MKRSLVFAVLVFAGTVSAQPKVIDFRGVPLGASEAMWKEKIPEIKCSDPTAGYKALVFVDRSCSKYHHGPEDETALQFGGTLAGSISAEFRNDRLGLIQVSIKSDRIESVVAALTEKFGKPTSVETPEFKTRGGLTGTNTITVWRIGSSQITATRFASSISDGQVAYTDDAGVEEFSRRSKAAAKAGAKTL